MYAVSTELNEAQLLTSAGQYVCLVLVRHDSVVKYAVEGKMTALVLSTYSRNPWVPCSLLHSVLVIFEAKCESESVSHSVMSKSLQPHGL